MPCDVVKVRLIRPTPGFRQWLPKDDSRIGLLHHGCLAVFEARLSQQGGELLEVEALPGISPREVFAALGIGPERERADRPSELDDPDRGQGGAP
jgi:hypothetical protein